MLLMLDAKIDASHAGSLKSVIRALLLVVLESCYRT